MKFTVRQLFLIPISLLIFSSCAKDVAETSDEVQARILKSYLNIHNYQDVEPTESGVYIVEKEEGTGTMPQDSNYVFVRYSTKYLAGAYASTTYDSVAKLLGTYNPANFYGRTIWGVGTGYTSTPVYEILKTMKTGGKTVSVIPPWLLVSSSTTSSSSSTTYSSEGVCLIYEIELDSIITDMDKYQYGELENYSKKYYDGIDSLSLGYYFKKIHSSGVTDTLEDAATINVRYVGKLLNGYVFDTNIADTAKKYNLYDKSSSYNALEVTFYNDASKLAEENSCVSGFAKALTSENITYGDKAITFFDTSFGYGFTGSMTNGKGVPPYYPMFFEIWIEEKE